MAIRIRRRKAHTPRASRLIRAGDRTMTFVQAPNDQSDGLEMPSIEEINAALEAVPEDLTWDWSSSRLIPLFERGYGEGVAGDQMVNTVSHLGVGIGFGIDFGPAIGRVTESMARRWEASVEQLKRAAFAHLAEVVARVTPSDLQTVVHRGHLFRALGEPAGWASSVVLASEAELIRILGSRHAIITLPARNSLLAFPPATPSQVVAEVTWELESMDPHPLRIDPFVMVDGVLRWQGFEEEPADIV